jgi:type I restriction enzyme R subunit
VGSEKRIAAVAKDIVEHYERRAATLEGKAMVVCMSRRICVALHDAIRQLRPAWFDADDAKGSVKVVITGSASDGPALNAHVRPKSALRALQNRVRGPNDPLKIVIVRDMWLTGFDAPVLHTMYVDKPMQGHSLMQAIARVNRVFKDKPGGLVVDYLGIADALKEALALYSESSRKEAGIPIEDALKILRTQHDVLGKMFHGIAYQKYAAGSPEDALRLLAVGVDRVVGDPELKERFIQQSARLRAAVGLAGSHEKAAPLLPDVRYFLDVRASVLKGTVTQHASDDKDSAIREILNAAIAPEGVIDILAASGIAKPDIGILSDEFLDQISKMPQRNLAMELLMKLLHDEVRARARRNLVQGRSFREMLDATMARYANRAIDSAQVIAELVELAKDMREARKRGEELGLTPDEEAFYDALAENASARNELGDENLKIIAREVVKTIKSNVSIDWTMKEAVRARLRLEVRKVLRKYGYPPDKQEAATTLVLEQATLTLANWPHS